MSWPGSGDPYYLYNPTVNIYRRSLYSVPYVPYIQFDGLSEVYQFSTDSLRDAVRERLQVPSPCTIEVQAHAEGTTIWATAVVTAEEDMNASDNGLLLVLFHNDQWISQDHFTLPMRDIKPDASGETFRLEARETFELTVSFSTEPGWDLSNMSVIAFVQNLNSLEVLQAAQTGVVAEFSMDVMSLSKHTQMVPSESEAVFSVLLSNTGLEADTYTATLTADNFPPGWTRTIEIEGEPPEPSSVTISLDSQTDVTILIRLNPNGRSNVSEFTLNVTSHQLPEMTKDIEFSLFSGLDILIVDGDDTGDFETYYEEAIEAQTVPILSGTWETSQNELTSEELSQVDYVIWETGNRFGCFSDSEEEILIQFLDDGGALFLTGRGVASDLGYPHPGSRLFVEYLHADYVMPYSSGLRIAGVHGDPISDGMDFAIEGGTGANNQMYQDDIDPIDEFATVFLKYNSGSPGHNAGLRIETDDYRVVLLGFGFEGIAEEEMRNQFMERVLDWLEFESDAEPDAELSPITFSLGPGYPNPFNPVITIPYTLGARSSIRLSVSNIIGREVAVLALGMKNPGNYIVRWNASGLSSGIYFTHLSAGTQEHPIFSSTQKLILLK